MTTPHLRPYQQEAVEAIIAYWNRGGPGSPLVEMPTGSGKSLTLASVTRRICEDYGARVLVLAHRKELISQDANAIRSLWPEAQVGIWSAGLGSRQVRQVTVAGVQSVWRKADALGHVDVVIVDEAHLISTDESTTYARLLADLRATNPDLRLVGFTATPYRVGQGMLTDGDGALFDCISYKTSIRGLISDGYLSPLVPPTHALVQVDTSQARTIAGEWALSDLEMAADLDTVNDAVAGDVADAILAGGRTSALVFGVSVAHAEHLEQALRMKGINARTVVGSTPNRDAILSAFKRRELHAITSCDVLTTGFDAPVTDVLALVRPTKSPGLYVQMAGRGMRRADGKTDCLFLDYGGNIARHGPITDVTPPARTRRMAGATPTKMCPQCSAFVPAGASRCVHCDYEFPLPEKTANATASQLDPIGERPAAQTHEVAHIAVKPHVSKSSGLTTMRVTYFSPMHLLISSEYICLEHEGYARHKAERWWKAFFPDVACPDTVDLGVHWHKAGKMRNVIGVTTVRDGKYTKVKSVEFGDGFIPPSEKPPEPEPITMESVDADIPF